MSFLGAFGKSELNAFIASELNARGLVTSGGTADWRDRFEIVSASLALQFWLRKTENFGAGNNVWEDMGSATVTFSTFPRNGLKYLLNRFLRSIGFSVAGWETIYNVGSFTDDDTRSSRDFDLAGEVSVNYALSGGVDGDATPVTQEITVAAVNGVVTLTSEELDLETAWGDSPFYSGFVPTDPSFGFVDPEGAVWLIGDYVIAEGTGTFPSNSDWYAYYITDHAAFGGDYIWSGISSQATVTIVIQETSDGII